MGDMTRTQFITEIADSVGKKRLATAQSGAALEDRLINYLNWAQKRMARMHNFYELDVTIETSVTVDGVLTYPMVSGTNNLGLTRPKDIQSIRLIDSENSRHLTRRHYRWFDKAYPYPANYTEQRPSIYVRHGNNLLLFRIPDDEYSLYIRYTQWPADFAAASSTSSFENKDQVLLAAGIMETYLALEEYADAKIWFDRFIGLFDDARQVDLQDVDWEPQGEPFNASGGGYRSGEPWLDPYGNFNDPLYGYPE